MYINSNFKWAVTDLTAIFMHFCTIIRQSVSVVCENKNSYTTSQVQDSKPTKLTRGMVTYLAKIKTAKIEKKKEAIFFA